MELKEAIYKRRTIRIYNNDPVNDEEIRELISAAIQAPTACNFQLWKFIVINDLALLNKIYSAGGAAFIKNVKQAILVTYSNQTDNLEYKDFIESASASIENMLLMATELGIGTCWVNNLPNKSKLRNIFGIPRGYDPIALITIGHYDKEPKYVARKNTVDELISYNYFDFKDIEKKNQFKLWIIRVGRIMYKILPGKRFLYKIVGRLEKKFDN